MQDLGVLGVSPLGDSISNANSINDQGQVVGTSTSAESQFRAFLWQEGKGMQDLGTLFGGRSSASGINSRSQVVGISADSGPPGNVFLWQEDTGMQDLGPLPGGTASGILGINDQGQFVGYSNEYDAILWRPVGAVAPTTVVSASPPANAAAWNNTNVTVTLSATDPNGLADVKDITYSATGAQPIPSMTISGNTATVALSTGGVTTLSYFATNQAGNQEHPKTLVVRIDKTPPIVTYGGNKGSYTVDQNVALTCAATDPPGSTGAAGSGVASSTCQNVAGPAYTFPLGSTTVTATATDGAGNVGTGSATFTVRVTYDSLCVLSRRWVTNQTLADGLCTVLQAAQRNDHLGVPSGKAGELAAYKELVQAAQRSGFVSADHAAVLTRLAGAL